MTAPTARKRHETKKHLLSTKRLHHGNNGYTYSLGQIFVLMIALQALIIRAELNGIEACQNRCFYPLVCNGVGNGLCCRWDDDVNQCISSIGHDICPGTATMPPPPSTLIACSMTAIMTLEEPSKPRTLSEIEDQYAPSASPTMYDDRSCDSSETLLDEFICKGFSITQIISHIIIGKISSTLSILGSSHIIQDVLRDPKKRNESTYHRIMFALSCSDIIVSFIWFLGSWAVTKGELPFAVGSEATCYVTGFFAVLFVTCTPLYNCSLATFYLLRLKFNWTDRKIKAVEKWLIYVPFTMGLIRAISSAAMGGFGPFGHTCTTCSIFLRLVYVFILLFSLVFVSVTMFLVYRAILIVENNAHRYSFARYSVRSMMSNSMGNMSRRIMLQGILYSAALFSQNIFFILVIIPRLQSFATFVMLLSIFYPLQGFMNALIYMIPLFRRIMNKRRETQQNLSIEGQHHTPKIWLIRWRMFWSRILIIDSKSSESISGGQIDIEGESKEEENENLDGSNIRDGILESNLRFINRIDVNDNQKQQKMIYSNASSESKGGNESEKEKIKGGEESSVVSRSSLMVLSDVEADEEEAIKSSSFALSHNPQPNEEGESHLECSISAFEADTEICNKVNNEGDESDDEGYVDDYLKMVED